MKLNMKNPKNSETDVVLTKEDQIMILSCLQVICIDFHNSDKDRVMDLHGVHCNLLGKFNPLTGHTIQEYKQSLQKVILKLTNPYCPCCECTPCDCH